MLKNKLKTKPVRLKNIFTNEAWICEDYNTVRTVDGVEFVEVHKENNQRMLWMNKANLVKVKAESTKTR